MRGPPSVPEHNARPGHSAPGTGSLGGPPIHDIKFRLDSLATPCESSRGRGRRRAKAQGLGLMPCRAARRLDGFEDARPRVALAPLLRSLLPVADKPPVGDLRLAGELDLGRFLRLA